MIGIVYDTETTGLPLFNEPSEDPRQPHLVQLAACLVDLDSRAVISSMDVMVEPSGWEIPDETAAIHGITTERACAVGVKEQLAVEMFLQLWSRSGIRIAHNEQFDARIIRIALLRYADTLRRDPDLWKASRCACTQLLSTPILKLPPTEKMRAAGRNHFKSANLREAYQHFTGQELAGAHNAMVDVRARMTVYLAIKGTTGTQEAC